MSAAKPKSKVVSNREMPPPIPRRSNRLRYGDRIYLAGSTQDYIVLGEVAITEAPPEPEDTSRDPYG